MGAGLMETARTQDHQLLFSCHSGNDITIIYTAVVPWFAQFSFSTLRDISFSYEVEDSSEIKNKFSPLDTRWCGLSFALLYVITYSCLVLVVLLILRFLTVRS